MVEVDDLDKLAEGMGRLDGPRAGLDEFDELLSLEAQWNEARIHPNWSCISIFMLDAMAAPTYHMQLLREVKHGAMFL